MAVGTVCQTPGAVFTTAITPDRVTCSVEMPEPLRLSEQEAALLEANLHNAVEMVLAPHFELT